jgi:hypothetical protein
MPANNAPESIGIADGMREAGDKAAEELGKIEETA